jgi:bifunctional DNA-binding transcriptional regulator/antitoxin component of YhaV-PrlF toxin-antitoxin module
MEEIIRMDEEGRIYIPKKMRKSMKSRIFRVREEKGTYIFHPIHATEKGKGIFTVKEPVKDIDEKIKKYSQELLEDELR